MGRGARGKGGSSFIQSLGRICPGLTINVKKKKGPIGGGAELVKSSGGSGMCVDDSQCLDLETVEGCLVASCSPRSLGIWQRVRRETCRCKIIPTANLTGYCATCPAAFSFTGPPPWHKKHFTSPLLHSCLQS